jgi:hypothetical protein
LTQFSDQSPSEAATGIAEKTAARCQQQHSLTSRAQTNNAGHLANRRLSYDSCASLVFRGFALPEVIVDLANGLALTRRRPSAADGRVQRLDRDRGQRDSPLRPSHTTGRAGPHPAVRMVEVMEQALEVPGGRIRAEA